jgi:hypothetical protein
MRTLCQAGWIALTLTVSWLTHAADALLPPELQDWQSWVLHGQEYRQCPFISDGRQNPALPIPESDFRCVWPERLTLTVDSRGGSFTQRWQVFAKSWVALPGDDRHWPRDVRLNGDIAPVVRHRGVPSLHLAPGTYTVSGRFAWESRPESLPLPQHTAIVDLFVDGSRVSQPDRPDGDVWLGKRRSAAQAAAMDVQVYRLVDDEIPTYLTTRIRLNVAGEAREERLARVLPDGFTPVSLNSDLPARLERDGTMRVQVRAGSREVTLSARGAAVLDALTRPEASGGQWPAEEVWSFAANDLLRVAMASGPEGIDPAQANVPDDWRQFPAFRMAGDSKLVIDERSRGLSNVDDNRLQLQRSLWLDFDHQGFTAVDHILGDMRRDWRLDMQAPFSLQSAKQNRDQLLVTEGADGRAGVEIRQPRLSLTTVARKESASGAMPATGWQERFENVAGTVYLPPGHRLLAAIGTDSAPSTWWELWGLWNVFGVLLVVVFVYWTAGLIPAAVAVVALLLTYQEAPAFLWLWGNLLAALAIARAAPEGRFRRFARGYRTLSFVVLGLTLLPFLWQQIRYALYPQLEPPRVQYSGGDIRQFGVFGPLYRPKDAPYPELQMQAVLVPPADADAAVAPASEAPATVSNLASPADSIVADDIGRIPDRNLSESLQRVSGIETVRANVTQRYAAGTALQAGPGIPSWHFNAYSYSWSGPVEAADTVRFVYAGPAAMFLWRLAGVLGLAVLFAWLAMLSFDKNVRWPRRPGASAASLAGWLAPALLFVTLLGAASPALATTPAAGAPADSTLVELRRRLINSPPCTPSCSEITAARAVLEGERLEVTLQVSALANVAVAMPHASDRWQLDEVTLDGRGTLAIARDEDGLLWVPVSPGAHTVRLAGRLAAVETIQVAFPHPPRVIDVSARGWTASGVNEGRLVSGSLELARERDATRASAMLEAGVEFPAFVTVHRLFDLDLDWTMETTVVRVAPQRAAMSVEVPLVAGESVLNDDVKVRDNEVALVGFTTGQQQVGWQSALARSDTLEIALPQGAARHEVWSFLVNPQWNVEFEGFVPVLPENVQAANWIFRFAPRPGEKLTLKVSRPQSVKGSTVAVDSVTRHVTVGARSTSTEFELSYRSTQGGRQVIKLPPEARVTAVTFDGRNQPLRPEKGELPLSLTPGTHTFRISWEESRDLGFRTTPSAVDLGTPASNLETRIDLPESRWILAAWGPGVGPAVLYWSELVAFIGVAWLLGCWSRSPLRFHEWLLLGLGLSTQSWFVFALTAVWLITLRWRAAWKPGSEIWRWRYNAVQVGLALFTLVTILTLVFSGIRNGLLASPDMHIAAANAHSTGYTWFQDRTSGVVDSPTIVSVPMWVYRVLFFVWALWMAMALVRWLRWSFDAWKAGGLWRGKSAQASFPGDGDAPPAGERRPGTA